jgi:hypothetical protein
MWDDNQAADSESAFAVRAGAATMRGKVLVSAPGQVEADGAMELDCTQSPNWQRAQWISSTVLFATSYAGQAGIAFATTTRRGPSRRAAPE